MAAELQRREHRRTTGRTVIRPARRAAPPPDPPPGRRRRAGLLALVAVGGLALLVLGPAGVALLVRDYATGESTTTHRIGEPVRDGPITFVVHQVRCGPHEDSVHGRLCEVTLGARNDGEDRKSVV